LTFSRRLTILAGLFLAMFSVLALRLWFVQVAEGEKSDEQTRSQTEFHYATPAPRGDILDRRGEVLATNRYVPALLVDRRRLSVEQRPGLVQALSSLLEIPPEEIDRLYEEAGPNGRFRAAVVDTATAYRVNEQADLFPGVSIERVPERLYLAGSNMAHVLGHLGLPDQEDLATDASLEHNTRIGKLGVERNYEEYLRGTPGELSYIRDINGTLRERPEVLPQQGNTLYLTLDLSLQRVVEDALDQAISLSNQLKAQDRAEGREVFHVTERAAAVVLDVTNGAVAALASRPAFEPELFVGGLDPATFAALNREKAFLNLAISGLYPPASTFKAVTYVAAVEEDIPLASPNSDPASKVVNCNGLMLLPGFDPGSPQRFRDWYYPQSLGWLNLHAAFEKSCNLYFYSIALGVWQNRQNGIDENIIQSWARDLGFGSSLGIDLPGERDGIVPDRALFESWKEYQEAHPDEPRLLDPARLELDSPWLGGDLMNLAIGQGSFTSTPLQLAAAYAAIANGGTVWRPYVVDRVVDREGQVAMQTQPAQVRSRLIDPTTVDSILTDMGRVVRTGTAAAAFSDFGRGLGNVGGKTGTAQPGGENDNHALFAGVLPLDDPKFVVVVLVEEGGSGGRVAAPAARHIMQYLMGVTPTPVLAGEETD
jgi:penicillin-binding protein 2